MKETTNQAVSEQCDKSYTTEYTGQCESLQKGCPEYTLDVHKMISRESDI